MPKTQKGSSLEFSIAHLYVTRHCPYSCSYCGVRDNTTVDLPAERWVEIINKLAPYAQRFNIIGGEPLVYNGIWDIVAHLLSLNKTFNISTALTTKENLRRLSDAGVPAISVSLDSLNGGEDGTELKNENALFALDLWRGIGPNFCGIVVSPWNIDGILEVIRYVSDRGFYCCINPVNVNSSDTEFGRKSQSRTAEYLGKLRYLADILRHTYRELLLADPPEYFQEWRKLPFLWRCSHVHSIAVDSDGSLSPCISLYRTEDKYIIEDLDKFLRDYRSIIRKCEGCMMGCSWVADTMPGEIR